jgi:hypothetical protein
MLLQCTDMTRNEIYQDICVSAANVTSSEEFRRVLIHDENTYIYIARELSKQNKTKMSAKFTSNEITNS